MHVTAHPPPAKGGRPRDGAIEGLRGLAAITVLGQHVLFDSIGGWSPPGWTTWLAQASAAVMVFFVLSGYVIGLTYRGPATASAVQGYAWRRLVRLMPINFVAVLLGCAAATSLDWPTVLGNLLFLQNFTDYAGLQVSVLETNANLWSLNYEVVYYLLFVPVWLLGARLRIAGLVSLAVLLLGWYTRFMPLFLACYAAGFLFWLAGLALAWRTEQTGEEQTNWPSCLLLALLTSKLEGLRLLLSHLPMPGFAGPVVRLYALDFLPVAVWLLAAVTRRSFPGLTALKVLCALIPAAGFIGHLLGFGRTIPADLGWMLGTYVLALVLWRWRPSLRIFRQLAPVGLVSFALYAVASPIQKMVFHHSQALPANAAGFAACVSMAVGLSFGVAWYLERRVQPALRHALIGPPARSPAA